ncbi:hypothetical protein L9F63_015136, partial [Diploptera punctata]
VVLGPTAVSCLQTVNGVGRGINPEMDALSLVIEDVQIMEEVEWNQEEIPLQEQQTVIHVLQLCRICAVETSSVMPVFGEEGSSLRLAEKIYWYLPIETCSSPTYNLRSNGLRREHIVDKCINRADFKKTASSLSAVFMTVNFFFCRLNSNLDSSETSAEQNVPLSTQLPKAMEMLKKIKQNLIRKLRVGSQERSENVEEFLHENFVKLEAQFGSQHYENVSQLAESDNTSINTQSVDDMKSEPSDFLDIPVDADVNKRPQRQIKRKYPEDGEFTVKTKLVGAEQENEPVKKRRIPHKDWKCQTCGMIFEKKLSLIIHQMKKHYMQHFSCSYCDKTFKYKTAMKIHERSHTEMIAEKIVCEYCGKSFRGKKTLREHYLANHSEVKPYKCDKCDKTYGSMTSLDIHKATHSNETPFLCDLCGKSFKHVSNLRSHKRSHMNESDKNKQVCDVCGKGFRSRFHLSEHMNVHTGRRPYACNVCGKHFHKKIQLRQHGSAHSGVQPFKCNLCGVRFNRRGNMTQHLKRHDREQKYTCRVCNEGFATLGAVLSHRKKHSKEEVESSIRQHTGAVVDPEQVAYKCEVCGKLLAKKDSLTIHMRSHTGEKPYECGVCGKRLSNKGSLSYHMRSFHTGERPHTCQYCGEGFLSRESRLVHERIHTGEKPYVCGSCGMGFRCSSNLAQHARVHSEARPHACPHCDKRFQRKGALDVHIRTHTGEKPYACEICSRRFTQKNDMLKHRRTHSPEQCCLQCGKLFSHKRDLVKHEISTIHDLVTKFETTGSVQNKKHTRRQTVQGQVAGRLGFCSSPLYMSKSQLHMLELINCLIEHCR